MYEQYLLSGRDESATDRFPVLPSGSGRSGFIWPPKTTGRRAGGPTQAPGRIDPLSKGRDTYGLS